MLCQPFLYKTLRRQRKIPVGHFQRCQIKHPDAFTVNCVNVRWIVFLRLKKHLYHDTIESCYFWHVSLLLLISRLFTGKAEIVCHIPLPKASGDFGKLKFCARGEGESALRLGGTPRPTLRRSRGDRPTVHTSLHDLPMAGLLVALATNKSLLHKCTYRRVDGVFIEPQFGHHPTIGKKRILPQSFINLTT